MEVKNKINKYDSKIESFYLNNTIGSIHCYQRPHINNFISRKNIKIKNKILTKKLNINLRKTKEKKICQYKPQIESRLINFYKMNPIEKTLKNLNYSNKENYSPNYFMNKTKSLFNLNKNNKSTCPSTTKLKSRNLSKIKGNNNNLKNKSFKENSISKDIAILCKIINSINYTYNNELEINRPNKRINSTKNFNLNSSLIGKNIIKIQRWWRNRLYHLYIEKYVIMIQKYIRKYLKKKKYDNDYKNKSNLKKVIIIQKSWKNYMKNKYLNNYYYFSFKKYLKPKKETQLSKISKSNLKNNMNIINIIVHNKNKFKNNYITKIYFKTNQINDINNKITKLQNIIRKYLSKKSNNNNLLLKLPKIKKCFITKDNKNNFILNKKIILKISKIQKNIRKYLSFKQDKMSLFTFGHNNKIESNLSFNNNKNTDIIKKIFSNYISYKLSNFFILTLNRINLFYFIKIFIQRLKKNIKQFIYIKLFNTENENNFYSYFFKTIWRHIKINIKTTNEITILLRSNIPKFFKVGFEQNYIPYIKDSQENNLINTQLFLNNDDELVNYILYFLKSEKKINININKKSIIMHLNNYNLKNQNIFCLTRYIDSFYNDLITKKIDLIEKNNEENFKDNYYIQTEENNDIKSQEFLNPIKINFEINRTNTYCIKKFRCKFIDYLNNK